LKGSLSERVPASRCKKKGSRLSTRDKEAKKRKAIAVAIAPRSERTHRDQRREACLQLTMERGNDFNNYVNGQEKGPCSAKLRS